MRPMWWIREVLMDITLGYILEVATAYWESIDQNGLAKHPFAQAREAAKRRGMELSPRCAMHNVNWDFDKIWVNSMGGTSKGTRS